MSAVILHFREMSELPNRIRELREARGLSQDALAARLGCSKMLVSGMERGKHNVSLEWMKRIAEELGVNTADLLNDEDNPLRLDAEELELIERRRAANEQDRETLHKVADAILPFRHRKDAA